ncbi:hypothetical protein TRV_00865 [Trichophyton verrucosum HKI 0517]|uniref:Uncharacterized protein n=1 Tax=Trichophyton verrucosum (strain HKI 0517) TaxID=663202 RepID=D4D1B7_TRIVH|nr:uncharacterized protein TRV_00865 [Trichophyton verrucosum HKI 0517]EFE44335.1 hypothetical protein TRV_00865 [Trichophyton verrucosum HKI 0517]
MPVRTARVDLSSLIRHAVLAFLVIYATTAEASCECGFVINDTQDYYTHLIHNNFSTYSPTKPLSTNPKFTRDWAIQKWGLPVMNWATPLPILNRPENVYLENGQLTLRQEGYSKESDDKNEIDIEILTREFKPDSMLVHYTTHPALDDRGWLIDNATEIIALKGHRPAEHFQLHRFDWTKEELRFYQNSKVVHTNNLRIPKDEGSVYLNLWADGGMWSGSPSTTDVYLRVKHLSIYHNTSASENGTDTAFSRRCQRAGGLSTETVCYDVHINSGLQVPSSKSKSLAPRPFWVLFLFSLALASAITSLP